MKKLFLICAVFLSSSAFAQNYGALVGVHQTSADVSTDSTTVDVSLDGKMGYKLGLAVSFDLMEGSVFRTGLIYNKRMFEVGVTGAAKGTIDFDYAYFDIPALYQYNFNEMFGLFGGLIVAFNSSDSVSVPAALQGGSEIEGESLLPLLHLGGNLMFEDQIGFDFYYERGMGKVASNDDVEVKDFSTFGANFLYWF